MNNKYNFIFHNYNIKSDALLALLMSLILSFCVFKIVDVFEGVVGLEGDMSICLVFTFAACVFWMFLVTRLSKLGRAANFDRHLMHLQVVPNFRRFNVGLALFLIAAPALTILLFNVFQGLILGGCFLMLLKLGIDCLKKIRILKVDCADLDDVKPFYYKGKLRFLLRSNKGQFILDENKMPNELSDFLQNWPYGPD